LSDESEEESEESEEEEEVAPPKRPVKKVAGRKGTTKKAEEYLFKNLSSFFKNNFT